MGGATIIIWILVFFGIFYCLAIRPQRRQKQQHAEMVSMLKKGDEVVTIGGMFGTISGIGDDWVELEVAKRTRVRYLKRAISSITSIDEYDDEEEDEYIESGEDEEEYEDAETVDEDETEEAEDAAEDEETDEIVEEATDETPKAPDAPEAPKA
jgi:preprotein translocase subunit YajC